MEIRSMAIPYKNIERKWQQFWQENKTNKADLKNLEKKCYTLVMFSYPSSDKLHLGHWFNYAPTDTWARFKRMQGFNVFEPMGFDAFGLPAENYAVKTGVHPAKTTENSIRFIREQLKAIGAMYDWDYEINTSTPEYYKWTQWLFLKLYERGLAYRDKAPVNWCPHDKTVLANEQVHDGKCERCGTEVIKKNLTQWFFKITDYADELLDGLDKIDWPDKTKIMQRNWIGKSSGLKIRFAIDGKTDKYFDVFTTRPDTLFGVTYAVLAPEHSLVREITLPEYSARVEEYIASTARISEIDRMAATREKSGVFTGSYVLKVILKKGEEPQAELKEAFVDKGTMINSAKYDGLSSVDGAKNIGDDLSAMGSAEWTTQYKLRDWLVSRQRYWGAPIPVIYCDKCGEVAVPEKDLPVKLPQDVDFNPQGTAPLGTNKDFTETLCPKCGASARREVDTMDTFVCSSWYYLRYPDPHNDRQPWDIELINKMLPVDKYVGGAEHSTMHLLYSRFITKALRDMGYVNFDEPFQSLVHQGVIMGPDGNRMSKSRGNVVNPEKYLDKYGSDVFRMYLMFGFAYTDGGPWDDSGIAAIDRYLNRVWRLLEILRPFLEKQGSREAETADASLRRVLHNSIKGVTEDTQRFHFNTSISRLMELTNELYKYTQESEPEKSNSALLKESLEKLVLMIAPFTPHLGEELWEKLGKTGSIFDQPWPLYEEKYLKVTEIEWVLQVNGKIRDRVPAPTELSKDEAEKLALHSDRVQEFISGKTIRKVIVVPKKLVNIVVS